jgi:site-specific DNA-methyltransferase (adenine-specific)
MANIELFNGDCIEIMRGMPNASVDFIFTDPPYGHNNNNGDLIHLREAALGLGPVAEARPIANDGQEANDLFRQFLVEAKRLLKPGCCCCCCSGGGGPDPQFARWSLWMDEIIGFKQAVVWDKGPIGMGWHYRRSYEFVLVAQKPGAACHWYDETNQVENIIRKINKIIPQKENHPTEKPVALASWFIHLHTRPGDTVLDPFMGHGSTGEACFKAGRNFIGIELDKTHFDKAQARLERVKQSPTFFTGFFSHV